MIREYKSGSDIIEVFRFVDQSRDLIDLSELDGYGVALYSYNGLIGKWGVNLTGFVEDTDVFSASGDSQCTLSLSSDLYGSAVGEIFVELHISYLDSDFTDGLRNLWSDKKVVFKIRV